MIFKITEFEGSFSKETETAFLHVLQGLKLMLLEKRILRFSCSHMELRAGDLR